ncbi:hypothetical protein L6452_43206 [Arctium lappa]|uniref:Uncharacterized protein n=1 Tax=Arctium lappa TaxID=4217 RepID=A0ACB8XL59_ARCLA|nr:hypothetical protein L6452_43206 [Arctium lappa]
MPIKRSRTTRSCVHLEKEVVGVDVGKQSVEQSSSAIGAQNKAARTSFMVDHVVNPPIPLDREVIFTIGSPPLSPQRALPVQIQLHGGGFSTHTNPLLPPTFLDVCNYCKERIQPNQDMYMNGGLEAYCSPVCRDNFNNMMRATGNQSPESEPSTNHLSGGTRSF